jgi:hypothetical protein
MIVGEVLGLRVYRYDTGVLPGMVDARVHRLDGGVLALLEVSSVGRAAEAEGEAAPGTRKARDRIGEGLRVSWRVGVPRSLRPERLEEVPVMLRRCERLGVTRSGDALNDPVVAGLVQTGVCATVDGTVTGGPPVIKLRLDGDADVAGEDPEGLAHDLDLLLASPTIVDRVGKLRAGSDDPFVERHLFLDVRASAVGIGSFETLTEGAGDLPRSAARLLEGLTAVWLRSTWTTRTVIRAVAGKGWVRSVRTTNTDWRTSRPRIAV